MSEPETMVSVSLMRIVTNFVPVSPSESVAVIVS